MPDAGKLALRTRSYLPEFPEQEKGRVREKFAYGEAGGAEADNSCISVAPCCVFISIILLFLRFFIKLSTQCVYHCNSIFHQTAVY